MVAKINQTARAQPIRIESDSGKTSPTTNDLTEFEQPAKEEAHARLNVPFVDVTLDLRLEGKALYLEAGFVHLNARGDKTVGPPTI
jgi:hypothetical protein